MNSARPTLAVAAPGKGDAIDANGLPVTALRNDVRRAKRLAVEFAIGDAVTFVTNYPGHEGETVSGRILMLPDPYVQSGHGFDVWTDIGRHVVPADMMVRS